MIPPIPERLAVSYEFRSKLAARLFAWFMQKFSSASVMFIGKENVFRCVDGPDIISYVVYLYQNK